MAYFWTFHNMQEQDREKDQARQMYYVNIFLQIQIRQVLDNTKQCILFCTSQWVKVGLEPIMSHNTFTLPITGSRTRVKFSIAPLTQYAPLLWWLTGLQLTLTVKVDETYSHCHHFYSRWQNFLQSVMKLTLVHRTAPVSFITDCKSYATNCKSNDSTCKFCQPLQSVTISGIAIRLTITRGGAIEIKPSTPRGGGGDWKQQFLISYAPGAYWVGAIEIISPGTGLQNCSHCTGTWNGTRPIVSYCASPGPCTCPVPVRMQCERASRQALVLLCLVLMWT